MPEEAPTTFFFPEGPGVPNHDWPLLVYRGALAGLPGAGDVAQHLAARGWAGAWTGGVYPFTHYHSNAYEVLAVVAGRARVRFGGARGTVLTLEAGDVAALPAGTGHERVEASAGFRLVGAYPPEGQIGWDLRRPDREASPAPRSVVRAVPRPAQDPVYGAGGPLLAHWPALQ